LGLTIRQLRRLYFAKAGFLQNLQITSTITKKNIDQLEEMYQTFMPLAFILGGFSILIPSAGLWKIPI